MEGKNYRKSVHISISPMFYKCLDFERARTQKRLNLSRELSFREFSEMYIRGYKRLPPFKISNIKGVTNARKKR